MASLLRQLAQLEQPKAHFDDGAADREYDKLREAAVVPGQEFRFAGKNQPKRSYQGHQELMLAGQWRAPRDHQLPLGTLIAPANQPLARLEPEGEDLQSTWNFSEATAATYPLLRLLGRPK